MLRNPVLARGFSEIGLIVGWGTGIQVAQEALRKASLLRLPWVGLQPGTTKAAAYRLQGMGRVD